LSLATLLFSLSPVTSLVAAMQPFLALCRLARLF
jgi:hypothetical protein